MRYQKVERVRQLLVELTNALTSAALFAAEIQTIADDRGDGDAVSKRPFVDRAMFCIEWDGKVCFLGSTIMYRLLECLARRPNRYVSHSQLLQEAWRGVRELVTIRSMIRHLKDKLRKANMERLADAIVGRGDGYCLRLDRTAA